MIGNSKRRAPPPAPPEVRAFLAPEQVIVPAPQLVRARLVARARRVLRESNGRLPARRNIAPGRRLRYAAAASLFLVAGVTAAYQMSRRPPPDRLANEDRLAVSQTYVAPAAERPEPSSFVGPGPETAAAAARAAYPTTAPSRRGGLATKNEAGLEEVRLLVRARHADARGDPLSVLAALDEHERRFPSGRLSEERQALRIKALVSLGRAGEARRAWASFRRQFPNSVLLTKVDEMLAPLR